LHPFPFDIVYKIVEIKEDVSAYEVVSERIYRSLRCL